MLSQLNDLGLVAAKLRTVHRAKLILIVPLLTVTTKEVNGKRLLIAYQDGRRLLGD